MKTPCRIFCLGCLPKPGSSPEVTHWAVGPGLLVGGLYSPSHLSVVGYLQGLRRWWWWCHPPASCTLVERPLLVSDCLFVSRLSRSWPLYLEIVPLSATHGHSGLQLQLCLTTFYYYMYICQTDSNTHALLWRDLVNYQLLVASSLMCLLETMS